jgi:hypothetical protein
VASQVGDQSIPRRARWTLPPLAPLCDGVLDACHEGRLHGVSFSRGHWPAMMSSGSESGLVLAPPRPLPASRRG